MSEKSMHDPVLTLDEKEKVVYLKCSRCGKELWRPNENDRCDGAIQVPKTLGVYAEENIGIKDIFGG